MAETIASTVANSTVARSTVARSTGLVEPSAHAPRSARLPWTRAGLSGLVIMLLPFTWVVQLDGCTQTVGRASTGIDLLRDVHVSVPDFLLGLALFTLLVAGARWSALVERSGPRLALHVAALVATGALVFRGLSLVFGELEVRSIQPAGYIVVTALIACVADACVRVVLGAMEWSGARGAEPDG